MGQTRQICGKRGGDIFVAKERQFLVNNNLLTWKQLYSCFVCDEGTGAKTEVTKALEISILYMYMDK